MTESWYYSNTGALVWARVAKRRQWLGRNVWSM